MKKRTALLIRCNNEEAQTIREQAWAEFRSLSCYVLHILHRGLALEDKLFAGLSPNRSFALNEVLKRASFRLPGPRTAVLVRCSVEEARRIRQAASRRDLPISRFVLQVLHRSWDATAALEHAHPNALLRP